MDKTWKNTAILILVILLGITSTGWLSTISEKNTIKTQLEECQKTGNLGRR